MITEGKNSRITSAKAPRGQRATVTVNPRASAAKNHSEGPVRRSQQLPRGPRNGRYPLMRPLRVRGSEATGVRPVHRNGDGGGRRGAENSSNMGTDRGGVAEEVVVLAITFVIPCVPAGHQEGGAVPSGAERLLGRALL